MGHPTSLIVADRFWSQVDRTSDGCWPWTGKLTPSGYGDYRRQIDRRSYHWTVHRATYEMLVGPIPEGLVLDHLCRNRTCCNPAHLEPVTNAENLRRGRGFPNGPQRQLNDAGEPVCKNGHVVAGDNVRLRHNPRSPSLPIYDCIQCGRDRTLRAYYRAKVS